MRFDCNEMSDGSKFVIGTDFFLAFLQLQLCKDSKDKVVSYKAMKLYMTFSNATKYYIFPIPKRDF